MTKTEIQNMIAARWNMAADQFDRGEITGREYLATTAALNTDRERLLAS